MRNLESSTGWPRLVGDDVAVPLVTGEHVRYVNLDYAASTPALTSVKDAVDALLPWYSSVHRGAGFKSGLATDAYEGARTAVRAFTNARADDAILFTRNTTDSVNLLASALPPGTHVIAFRTEHHANLLPWRRHGATLLEVPASPEHALELLDDALRATGARRVVAVDGGAYFSRPGPRLVDGLELLAHVLHPDLFPDAPSRVIEVPV